MDKSVREICNLLDKLQMSLKQTETGEKESDDVMNKGKKSHFFFNYSDMRHLKYKCDLPLYLPSQAIKIAKDLNFSTSSLRDNHTEIIKQYLTDSKLDKDNICCVYKMLLQMEDITSMSEYVQFAQKDATLNCTGTPRLYWINLKNCANVEDVIVPLIDEVVLVAKESSDFSSAMPLKFETDLLMHDEDNNKCHRATVERITKDRVYFSFSKCHLLEQKFDVIFRSRRYALRYQHHALNLLEQNNELREYLFPKGNPCKELFLQAKVNLNLLNSTISSNPEQLEAVHNIVGGSSIHSPFIIFGPPGTGKTTVIVESILQLQLRYPNSRILVTAGSNSACDTIASRICKCFNSNFVLKYPKSILRIYSKRAMKNDIHLINSKLLKYTNCINGDHYYPSVEKVSEYGIIVATLCTLGKYVTSDVNKMNFFTHIFMDEAGASTLPESLVGIVGIKSNAKCRLILSGDHKQLGPILKSERAAQLGLKYSLMDILLKCSCYAVDDNFNYDHTLQARLKRNYRSHPEIVRLYNHMFYNNELIAEAKEADVNMAAKWCKLPNPNFPIIFQAVHGITKQGESSPSLFNQLELDVVMWFLRRLLLDGINGKKVNQCDIGIITPYKLQNERIRNDLCEHGWQHIESGSVETFQGREKQIIIASLVRSFSGLGFVANPKRLNVLLSRPKALLILIGNPLTLRRNSDYAFIIDECAKHNTFLCKKKTTKTLVSISN